MEKKTKKRTQKTNDWKNIVQVFIGDILSRVEDNLSQKIQKFISKVKRKAVASLLIGSGLVFFLTGIVTYASAKLDPILPGLGYLSVGVVVIFIGYLISRD